MKDFTQNGIIEAKALQELLLNKTPSLCLLDASFVLPTSDIDPQDAFKKGRIGNARFFDIHKIANQKTSLPHMLPCAKEFSSMMSALGISNNDTIVIYAQDGMVMGPARAWWMLRVFGHKKVYVLNGGLPAWKKEGFKIDTAPPAPIEKTEFCAVLQSELVMNIEQMKGFSQKGDAQIFDARPHDRFCGTAPEPRSGMRAGCIPGSQNCPASTLICPETGRIKSEKEILSILSALNFNPEIPLVTTCGSGITACFLALAFFTVGYQNISVYDGSWSEWGQEDAGTETHNKRPKPK